MPRKSPVSEIDAAIGRRMRELRVMFKHTRQDLARLADVSPDLINRVERGTMPLRYLDARNILPVMEAGPQRLTTAINPLWLAFGFRPVQLKWPLPLPSFDMQGVDYRLLFSEFAEQNRETLESLVKLQEHPEAVLPEAWLTEFFVRWEMLDEQAKALCQSRDFLGDIFRLSAAKIKEPTPMTQSLLALYKPPAKIEPSKKPKRKQ